MDAKEMVPFERTLSTEGFTNLVIQQIFIGHFCGPGTVHSKGWTSVGQMLEIRQEIERVVESRKLQIFK